MHIHEVVYYMYLFTHTRKRIHTIILIVKHVQRLSRAERYKKHRGKFVEHDSLSSMIVSTILLLGTVAESGNLEKLNFMRTF